MDVQRLLYSAWPLSFSLRTIKKVGEQANTNSNIQTSVLVVLPRRQLARKQLIVCIIVNQACKIQNMTE